MQVLRAGGLGARPLRGGQGLAALPAAETDSVEGKWLGDMRYNGQLTQTTTR